MPLGHGLAAFQMSRGVPLVPPVVIYQPDNRTQIHKVRWVALEQVDCDGAGSRWRPGDVCKFTGVNLGPYEREGEGVCAGLFGRR